LQHQHAVIAAAFSPDGQTILTGSNDDGAQFWAAATGKRLGAPCRHADIDFHHQGQLFQRLMSSHRQQDTIPAVAFSPDGKSFLIGSWFARASVWAMPFGLPGEVGAEQVTLWAQMLTGMKLDAAGVLQVLDAGAWLQVQQRLQKMGGLP
jgi:WD40 repeat protein